MVEKPCVTKRAHGVFGRRHGFEALDTPTWTHEAVPGARAKLILMRRPPRSQPLLPSRLPRGHVKAAARIRRRGHVRLCSSGGRLRC